MKINFLIFSLFFIFISCVKPTPRKPITRTGRIDMSESIAFNKKIYEAEQQAFQKIIKKDSLHEYIDSKHGFWYAYDSKRSTDSIYPVAGNEVVFWYDVKRIDGTPIYSKEELGAKTYLVDRQDFMQGIQEGIKLMKINEKMIFLLPSQKAYAYYGDEKKIGSNTALIVCVELIEIRNN